MIHADDLALCHAKNAGTIRAMEYGSVNSGSIMTTCPWIGEIAAFARSKPDIDLGVHLTLTNEWDHYRWQSVAPQDTVPTLVDGDVVITDSCAALVYLAKKYGDNRWLPDDPEGAARVQRWLSTASGELYRGPVIARAIELFGREFDYDAAVQWTDRLLPWMQDELADRTWLAGDHVTIADIAMYSYLRVADEGGLEVDMYPAIERWLEDVEQLDGFIPMARAG